MLNGASTTEAEDTDASESTLKAHKNAHRENEKPILERKEGRDREERKDFDFLDFLDFLPFSFLHPPHLEQLQLLSETSRLER